MIGTPVVERVNFSDTLRSNLEARYRKIFQDFQGLLLSYYEGFLKIFIVF